MKKYIALLRGINVGGNRKIKMADLRAQLTESGLSNVQTYIQSGNVIFDYKDENVQMISDLVVRIVEKHYGFTIAVMTFEATAFQKIVAAQPFKIEDATIKMFHVTMTAEEIPADAATQLEKVIKTEEEVIPIGKVLFLKYPNGYGRSKLTNNSIEKILKTKATTRNWRTMLKLAALSRA